MISEVTINSVRAIPVSEIVGSYLQLKKSTACCPFHNEKTPSFRVDDKRNIYKCFGCGEGGDGISFVMKMDRIEFQDAVLRIAEQMNIPVEYEQGISREEAEEKMKVSRSLRSVLLTAQVQFSELLAKNKDAELYLRTIRQYDEHVIKKWGLGYGGKEWRTLCNIFSNDGSLLHAIKTGLVKENKQSHYDVYKERITFALHDDRGNLIGFAGRKIGDMNGPKYINPTGTAFYDKSKHLYGLHHAMQDIKDEGFVYLVEGYTDVISMHEHGNIRNTVSTSGTALTDEQCILLKRYTSKVTLARDPDKAGVDSLEKGIKLLLGHGFEVSVLKNCEDDPDALCLKYVNDGTEEKLVKKEEVESE